MSMIFESQIEDIPCQIRIIECLVVPGSFNHNAASDLDFNGYDEVEFEILDQNGKKAQWLESKLTDCDIYRIEQECIDHCEKENEP